MNDGSLLTSELILARRSLRAMDPERSIPDEFIVSMLDAARWAPSAGNEQPWRYIIFSAGNPAALHKAQSCLDEGNQNWANRAPLLILSLAKETRANGKINPKALHDVGLANENLLLQAIELGLNCRPMGGFNAEKAIKLFGIPEGYRPVVMIAIGYPGDKDELPLELQEKEALKRSRKSLGEIIHINEWKDPSTFE